jgi:hypothetical protein
MAAATPPGALVADAAIARAATVAGAPFSSIGLWRLPGFEGRFSLCIVGDPAPFGGVPADRSNLPDPVGALIGRDALVHLLRNSLDHGLETPDERQAAGKSDGGRLEIAIVHHGDRIELTITDDGRGIDAAKVAATAVRLGLVSAERAAALADEAAAAAGKATDPANARYEAAASLLKWGAFEWADREFRTLADDPAAPAALAAPSMGSGGGAAHPSSWVQVAASPGDRTPCDDDSAGNGAATARRVKQARSWRSPRRSVGLGRGAPT